MGSIETSAPIQIMPRAVGVPAQGLQHPPSFPPTAAGWQGAQPQALPAAWQPESHSWDSWELCCSAGKGHPCVRGQLPGPPPR